MDILSQNCYLEPLYKEINVSSGVLNLHFEEGIYSEIPRLLSAYICGKVLYSEPLAAPFISGQHYIPLGSKVTFNTEEIYTNISKTFVQNFSLSPNRGRHGSKEAENNCSISISTLHHAHGAIRLTLYKL